MDADTGAAELKMKALTRRRRVSIKANVDRGFMGSLGRALDGAMGVVKSFGTAVSGALSSGFSGIVEGANQAASSVGKVGSGIAGMASNVPMMLALAAVIGVIAGMLGALIGILVTLASAWIGMLAVIAMPVAPIALAGALIAFSDDMKKVRDQAKATFGDLKKTFSSALKDSDMLPAIQKGLQTVSKWSASAQTGLKRFFDAGAKFIDPMVRSMTGFVDKFIGPFTSGLEKLANSSFAESMVTGMEELGRVFGEFFEHLSEYGADFGRVFEALAPMFEGILEGFAELAGAMAKIAPDIMKDLGEALGSIFSKIAENPGMMQSLSDSFNVMLDAFAKMQPLIMLISVALAQFAAMLMQVGAAIASGIMVSLGWLMNTAFPAIGTFFTQTLPNAVTTAWGIVQQWASNIATFFSSIWATITSTVSSAWSSIVSAISSAVSAVGSFLSSAWSNIVSGTSSAWQTVTSTISSAWSSITSAVSSAASAVGSAISSAWAAVKSATSTAWNAVTSAVRTAISKLLGVVRALPGQITSALGNLGSLLFNKGKELIQGFINGVKSMASAAKSAVGGLVSKLNPFSSPTGPSGGWSAAPGLFPLGYASGGWAAPTPSSAVAGLLSDIGSGVNTFGYGQKLGASLTDGLRDGLADARGGQSGGGQANQSVVINANTNADPSEIGREMTWQFRRMTR
ncbi:MULTISPECIES: phage tail protein [Streptomyces]